LFVLVSYTMTKNAVVKDNVRLSEDDRLPMSGSDDYSSENVQKRVRWIEKKFGVDLSPISSICEPLESFKGNIENLVGVASVPVGVIGPLKILGEFARGEFYVPLATTEGVLANSFHRGSRLITKAGGANVQILNRSMHVSPAFKLNSLREIRPFLAWLLTHFQDIKAVAEKTTKHGKLRSIHPKVSGSKVILKMVYDTADAMGMNMITIASDHAARYIAKKCRIKTFYPRSNYSSDKKNSAHCYIECYGRSVQADVILPADIIRYLGTTAKKMFEYYQLQLESCVAAGMHGANGQIANGIAALFIATGQDAAHVINSGVGITSCELRGRDIYVSVTLPSLLVGTVGGGTKRDYAKACLSIMNCYGAGNSDKFAEIAAALALSGELSILGALASGTFVKAHEIYGRNS